MDSSCHTFLWVYTGITCLLGQVLSYFEMTGFAIVVAIMCSFLCWACQQYLHQYLHLTPMMYLYHIFMGRPLDLETVPLSGFSICSCYWCDNGDCGAITRVPRWTNGFGSLFVCLEYLFLILVMPSPLLPWQT